MYFHDHKGDITRYIEWENLQPILERWHPELLKAHRDVEIAKRMLDLAVKSL